MALCFIVTCQRVSGQYGPFGYGTGGFLGSFGISVGRPSPPPLHNFGVEVGILPGVGDTVGGSVGVGLADCVGEGVIPCVGEGVIPLVGEGLTPVVGVGLAPMVGEALILAAVSAASASTIPLLVCGSPIDLLAVVSIYCFTWAFVALGFTAKSSAAIPAT